MRELWEIFIMFAEIGGFTFGGGYAMLPALQREVVEKRGWATEEEIIDYFAIGQCTPGIIAVNTATFIGHKRKGILGGIVGTLGMITPSLIIISIIAGFIKQFQENAIVAHAFGGLRIAVVALIASVLINLYKQSVRDKTGIILCILAFVTIGFLKMSPIIIIVVSALTGIFMNRRKGDAI